MMALRFHQQMEKMCSPICSYLLCSDFFHRGVATVVMHMCSLAAMPRCKPDPVLVAQLKDMGRVEDSHHERIDS